MSSVPANIFRLTREGRVFTIDYQWYSLVNIIASGFTEPYGHKSQFE